MITALGIGERQVRLCMLNLSLPSKSSLLSPQPSKMSFQGPYNFCANEATLPARLPTITEINAAPEVLSEKPGCTVVAIGDHFVVKYGVKVSLGEAETMLYLQKSGIPVPRIYAAFKFPLDNEVVVSYIIMERIHGVSLAAMYPSWDFDPMNQVAVKLSQIIEEMRKLSSPGGYCSVGSRGLRDPIFEPGKNPSVNYNGPFDTEGQLNQGFIEKLKQRGSWNKADMFYSAKLPQVLRDHDPVFTHGDLRRPNILFRTGPPSKRTGRKVLDLKNLDIVIIGWKFAGWYPSYWEYAKAMIACDPWEDDDPLPWGFWVGCLLKEFPNEYAWMNMLHQDTKILRQRVVSVDSAKEM